VKTHFRLGRFSLLGLMMIKMLVRFRDEVAVNMFRVAGKVPLAIGRAGGESNVRKN
jgi:hypothetical protein